MRDTTIQSVLDHKLIAIVRGLTPDVMIQTAQALYNGGIRLIEVTFDQKNPDTWQDTANAIHAISAHFNGDVLAGAGTVVSPEQVVLAYEAGAQYIISPHADPDVIRKTRALGIVSMPGCMTPTDILLAHKNGADFAKIFPADTLGAAYIKAIRAPISHVRMLAVGGVSVENAKSFLQAGCCGLGIGGTLVNKAWVAEGAFDKIEARAREFVAAVQ